MRIQAGGTPTGGISGNSNSPVTTNSFSVGNPSGCKGCNAKGGCAEDKYHGNLYSNPQRILIYLRSNPVFLIIALGYLLVSSHVVDRRAVWYKVKQLFVKVRVCDQNLPWDMASIATTERACPKPSYKLLPPTVDAGKICLVTLTDSGTQSSYKEMHNCRDFGNVLPITWENRKNYAEKHGYSLFDESNLLDVSRPPGWSKIHAIRHSFQEEQCNWTMWLDADTVFMNSTIKVQDILPASPDMNFLVAIDAPNRGWNSGVWLIRNTAWSRQFLDDWWNKKGFVRRAGLSKSGDNDALKALLFDTRDFKKRVGVPPRCTLNSFAVFLDPNTSASVEANVTKQHWYMSQNYFHKGDYIAHVAGLDNKVGPLESLLEVAL